MTQSKRLLSKRGAIRFERVIDSKGKVTGYLVNGHRYANYAEALRQFRIALNPRRYAYIRFRKYTPGKSAPLGNPRGMGHGDK